MVAGADHRREAGGIRAAAPRLRLAMVEEGVANAVAPVFRQQDAFAEVEQPRHVQPARLERGAKLRLLVQHRRCRGRADHAIPVERRDQHRIGRGGIFAQVFRLVGRVAIIEIGVCREDADAQVGQIAQHGSDLLPGQRADGDPALWAVSAGHQPTTCAVQSARL